MFSNVKQAFTASAIGLLSLSSLVIAARPSYAASIDLSTWTSNIGDVTYTPSTGSTPGNVVLSTATNKTVFTGGGTGSLEAFLQNNNKNSIPAGSLDAVVPSSLFGATEGSAIRNSLTVNAGDIFSFTYNVLNADSRDSGFVTIGSTITRLSLSGNTFTSPVFTNAGTFDVSIGIVDGNDTVGQSRISLSQGTLQPVPEPMTILGSMMALGYGACLRRRYSKKENN